MHRPPESVRFVAGTLWAVGGAVTGAIALIHFSTRHLPIEFGTKAYVITGTLAALYLVAGVLVWFGLPPGRALSRICIVLFVMRPRLAHQLGESMRRTDFQTHFASRTPGEV